MDRSTPSDGLTRTLAHYASGSNFDDLPAGVRHESARALLNWLGVAIAGSGEPAARIAGASIRDRGTVVGAPVIGQGFAANPSSAAFVNCIASSLHAFDDAHLPSVAHPSGPAVAACIALAQVRLISGKELLNAIALGIELQCRIANMLVLPPSTFSTGIYVNGFSGPVGVAGAIGRLLGLGPGPLAQAMGIAASQASGFRSTHGTMTAHFRPGHATRAGLDAALLVEQGFDCTEDALEAPGGLIDIFASGADLSIATKRLGEHHEMLENRYKPYPCGIVIHPVIDACLEIKGRMKSGAIDAVTLRVNPLVLRLTGKRTPTTTLESHVSVYHWAATALLWSKAGLAEASLEAIADADIRALRERMVAEPDPSFHKGEAHVTVRLRDEQTFEAHVTSAKGSRERPLTDAELIKKFHSLCDPILGRDRAVEVSEKCFAMAEIADSGQALRSFMA